MANDEPLREALLELQTLREREARSLTETKALLSSLENYTSAPDASAALSSVFDSLGREIGAGCSLLLGAVDRGNKPKTQKIKIIWGF